MKYPIPEQTWDQFYDPLVGTPERVQELTDHLTATLPSPADDLDPYKALRSSVMAAVDRSVRSIPVSTYEEAEWGQSLRVNGSIAVLMSVSVLRGLGMAYVASAEAPQYPENVRRNTRRVLAGVYGIAHLDSQTAPGAIMQFTSGKNRFLPGGESLAIAKFMGLTLIGKTPRTKRRAFVVTTDDDQQLDIRIRSKGAKPTPGGRRCPATYHRSGEPGSQRSSMLLLMGAIGDVANNAIYPRYFNIGEPVTT